MGWCADGRGGPFITIGVRFLFEWSPEETSWEAYHTMKVNRETDAPAAMKRPSVFLAKVTAAGIAPISHGAVAFMGMAF